MKAGILLGAALLICGGNTWADDKVLNVYNWSDLISEDTIAAFSKSTGIKVNYDTYDSDEVLEAKMMAGNTGYDLVFPSATFLQTKVKAGVLTELDRSKIPNWKNLDPALMKMIAPVDPENKHAALFDWGTTGLGINSDKVSKRLPGVRLDSYDLLFKPDYVAKLQDCGVTLVDSPSDVVPIVLRYLGLDPASENPADLDKALAVLVQIRPYVKYVNSSSYLNDLASGEVCLSLGWSGDVSIAAHRAAEAKNGVHLQYIMPKEGTMAWFGVMAVPSDAPHPDAAYAFINYLLKPEVAADFTNGAGYGNPIPDSLKLINPVYATDHSVFPTAEERERLFAAPSASQKYSRERTRAWTTFKTGS